MYQLELLESINEKIEQCQRRIGELEKNPPNYYFLYGKQGELERDLKECKDRLKRYMSEWTKQVNKLPKYN